MKSRKTKTLYQRSSAFKKRETSLGVAYANRFKRGTFIDSRQSRAPASQDSKRQALLDAKESVDQPIHVLTHKGVPIKHLKGYDRDLEDEDREIVGSGVVSDLHFGGGLFSAQDGEEPLSFKEKMQDLIRRSKEMKAERQIHQEELKDLVERLDDDWRATASKLATEMEVPKSRQVQRKRQSESIRKSLVQMNAIVNDLRTSQATSSGGTASEEGANDQSALSRRLNRLREFLDSKEVEEDAEEDASAPPKKKARKLSNGEATRKMEQANEETKSKKRAPMPFLEVVHCMGILIDMDEEKRRHALCALCKNLQGDINRFAKLVGALLIANLISKGTTLRGCYSPELNRFLCHALSLATSASERIRDLIVLPESTVSFLEISGDLPAKLHGFEANEQDAVAALESAMGGDDLGESQVMTVRLHCLVLLLHLLDREILASSKRGQGAPEALGPLLQRLERLPRSRYPRQLTDLVNAVLSRMRDAVTNEVERPALQWKQKRFEIEMVEPIFGEELSAKKRASKGQKRVPLTPAERTRRLKQKVKAEAKSAMRELRRDSEYLRLVKRKEQKQKDEDRKKKVARIMGDLAMQEGDFRKLSRRK